jgi:Ankyrin repeats (3 copies)
VALLLEHGADPNVRHRSLRFSALLVATFSRRASATVETLLRAGAAPSLATPAGWTALHQAAERNDLASARLLLEAGADPGILGGAPRETSALDRAKDPAAFSALLAELAHVSKQSEHEAEQVAESTFSPPPERFKEMAPLPLDRLTLGSSASPPAPGEFDALRGAYGAALPAGYEEMLGEFGSGLLHNKVRVYGPAAVQSERQEWLARIAEYWLWDERLVSRDAAQTALRLADTLDGHELIAVPREPDTLWLLPHEDDEVGLVSRRGFRSALSKLVSNRTGRLPRKLRYAALNLDNR